MIYTSKKPHNTTKSLIDAGFLTKSINKKLTGRNRKSLIATYSPEELATKPDTVTKLNEILAFFEEVKSSAKSTGYKFSIRDFIVEAVLKEVKTHTKK